MNRAVDRRCEAVRENGEPCRGTPALGETFCHAHARYRSTLNGMLIVVPLMEDEASVTFVRSQTVRALSQGSIPPANGQAMLRGCRDADRRLDQQLEVQKVALRYAALAEKLGAEQMERHLDRFMERLQGKLPATGCQRSGNSDQSTVISESERSAFGEQRSENSDQTGGDRGQETEVSENPVNSDQGTVISEGERSAVGDQRSENSDQRSGSSSGEQAASGVRDEWDALWEQVEQRRQAEKRGGAKGAASREVPTLSPTTGDKGGAPEPEPVMHRSVFPNVKEQWDQALQRGEGKVAEVVAPREGESWHDFVPRKEARDAAIAAAV
ncbi:MAG TPA: hypothetical protein VMD92_05020 [Acidobacteriaceae bacterium]|nr:hypothetical protein [Acidobacteriaceae bacterium]